MYSTPPLYLMLIAVLATGIILAVAFAIEYPDVAKTWLSWLGSR